MIPKEENLQGISILMVSAIGWLVLSKLIFVAAKLSEYIKFIYFILIKILEHYIVNFFNDLSYLQFTINSIIRVLGS